MDLLNSFSILYPCVPLHWLTYIRVNVVSIKVCFYHSLLIYMLLFHSLIHV